MSTSVTWNGTSYTVPAVGDGVWGAYLSTYLLALPGGALQKTGGAFTLSAADVLFGGTYGLQAIYYKSNTTGIAASGVVRLAKTDVLAWRNNAAGGDLALGIDGSDNLTFNSVKVPLSGLIVNADVASGAAVAYSKLALTGAILNADLAGSIADSKLSTIATALKVSNSATTAASANTASAIVARDGSGNFTAGTITAALTGNASTATLAATVTTNANLTGPVTSVGNATTITATSVTNAMLAGAIDLTAKVTGALPIANGGSGQATANAALNAFLPTQTSNSGKVLSTNGTDTSWAAALTSTLTSAHLFVGNGSNSATDVAVTGDVTISNAGVTAIGTGKVTSTMILDGTILDADINASAAIAGSKIAVAVSGTSAGVMAAGGVPGNITGSAIGSGYVGENATIHFDTSTVQTETALVLATQSLTQGIWNVTFSGMFYCMSATSFSLIGYQMFVNGTNSSIYCVDLVENDVAIAAGTFGYIGAMQKIVTLASTLNVVIKGFATRASGTGHFAGSMTCIRIA